MESYLRILSLSVIIFHNNRTVCFVFVTYMYEFMLTIFRYGEIVDVNLVRDKGTGKSKGFAFLAYEDQRSTNLAVGWFLSLSF